ncbi:MAG TPA: ABC transporter ATP-binding protein [Acidiferrobacterales bacterium]|nr:ABC transporter ATP-binding protein [Acidiferrobacterales bacterium]
MATNHMLVSLRGLRRAYQEGDRLRTVLNDLDLEIKQGECVALLGRSGCGKSTLLNLISGIDRADVGEIYINGSNLTGMSEYERTLFRRRHIGFVYQFFNLIPTLTVEENLLLPLELNNLDKSAALDLLSAVDLSDRRASFPDRLSGGEQQRVAIARALVHDPLLVLADEPTGNLDAETGRHMLQLLDRLVRKTGKTLLLVTHSQDAVHLADRVLTLENGRLAEPQLRVN